MDDLRRRGLISRDGRVIGTPLAGDDPHRPDNRVRVARAQALWRAGLDTGPGGLVARHLALRGVGRHGARDLLEHPCAPLAVYGTGRRTHRAMMAAIRAPDGTVSAVELTYLGANARPAEGLRLVRKTVGRIPLGSAVQLTPPAAVMLVAEGVVTTLSAMARFGRPGWALLSAGNLAGWMSPPGVVEVLIAADRGVAGERAATRLAAGLRCAGVRATIALPPAPWGDWNDVLMASPERRKEGLGRAPEASG